MFFHDGTLACQFEMELGSRMFHGFYRKINKPTTEVKLQIDLLVKIRNLDSLWKSGQKCQNRELYVLAELFT